MKKCSINDTIKTSLLFGNLITSITYCFQEGQIHFKQAINTGFYVSNKLYQEDNDVQLLLLKS
ncbi:hypothetical protein T05_3126 [Trichinella murrelli]|uniref:Uncharacterized protein n=1 Tax=Trichinella murrelli TaxID=144512 RepID=A0A0V0UEW3_9BILA|nr:hypothetical protein T05_3126 [Trichinella murrelli]